MHASTHRLRIRIDMSSLSSLRQKEHIYTYHFFLSSHIDDHTRVQLTNNGNDDYINASIIVSRSFAHIKI